MCQHPHCSVPFIFMIYVVSLLFPSTSHQQAGRTVLKRAVTTLEHCPVKWLRSSKALKRNHMDVDEIRDTRYKEAAADKNKRKRYPTADIPVSITKR